MSHRVRVYPHNDLLNLAHYQKGIINQKVNDNIEDAISLDCMSCLISLAFSVEAIVNFVGSKRVQGWRERKPYMDKMNQVCAKASLSFSKHSEPYKTLWELKELRDSIAHGKPAEFNTEIKDRDALRKAMACEWDKHLSPEYVNSTYERVKEFERLLFTNCKISVGEAVTSAVGLPV